VGLLSSRTMLVPTPAIDHAETVFQCVDDIIASFAGGSPSLGWMRRYEFTPKLGQAHF